MNYISDQKVINNLIDKIREIQAKAFYYSVAGSCGSGSCHHCDKIEQMCAKVEDEYSQYYSNFELK